MKLFGKKLNVKLLIILVAAILGCAGVLVAMSRHFDAQSQLHVEPEMNEMPIGVEHDMVALEAIFNKLHANFELLEDAPLIIVDISEQKLLLMKNDEVLKSYAISTSAYGIGSEAGSNKTPLGTHRIAQKIGANAPIGTLFKARGNTGRVIPIYTDRTRSTEDIVATRIMWLDGLEPGVNKGKGIDSHSRYIYIHGTQEEGYIGEPASHGCIRMKNVDVAELFDLVDEGTLVEIQE